MLTVIASTVLPGYIPFLHSVEFYVILTVVAAGVLALCIRPSRRGAAVFHTVEGWVCEGDDSVAEPRLEIECLSNGSVLIRRTALVGVGDTGNVSITVEQRGFDLDITENITGGRRISGSAESRDAVFVLSFLGQEWYHIHYTAWPGTRYAAFSLHVRPGIRTAAALRE